jgi:hypothetical protein
MLLDVFGKTFQVKKPSTIKVLEAELPWFWAFIEKMLLANRPFTHRMHLRAQYLNYQIL